jgi:hypothetical protein
MEVGPDDSYRLKAGGFKPGDRNKILSVTQVWSDNTVAQNSFRKR